MERALVGRAVAEEGDRDAAGLLQLLEHRRLGAEVLPDLGDLAHNLTVCAASLYMDNCRNCFSKALSYLEIAEERCVRVGANYLQETRPDMLRAGRVDGKCRVSVPCGCRADQFPGFSATSFADHYAMRPGTQSGANQVIGRNGWRSTFCFRARDRINYVLRIR